MQLDEALRQISDIREQMARTRAFRGYRSMTVAFSGAMGLAAAALQPHWVATPETNLGRYLGLWLAVALISLLAACLELYRRARDDGSDVARQRTMHAVEQFAPSVVVGALLTLIIHGRAPDVAWMLPGLWSSIFGLGIFASRRLLPRQVRWVGTFYVLCGGGCLLWGRGDNVLSPWLMGISFGGGQLLGAVILYWILERADAA